jgi:hypothetical protein
MTENGVEPAPRVAPVCDERRQVGKGDLLDEVQREHGMNFPQPLICQVARSGFIDC